MKMLGKISILCLLFFYQNKNFGQTETSQHPKINIIQEKHQSQDILWFKQNIYLVNCSRYTENEINHLKNKIEFSLKKGISCLKTLGPRWKGDALKLATLLHENYADPFVIRCQTQKNENLGYNKITNKNVTLLDLEKVYSLAQSFKTNDSTYPGMILSHRILPTLMKQKGLLVFDDRTSVLFHEFMHAIGYLHTDEQKNFEPQKDIVNSIEQCCFPESNRNSSHSSCTILKKYSTI